MEDKKYGIVNLVVIPKIYPIVIVLLSNVANYISKCAQQFF